MAADDAGERTEAPTPRRRQEAREEGQVARSTDLTAAVVLLAGLTLLNAFGADMFQRLLDLTREMSDLSDADSDGLRVWIVRAGFAGAAVMAPFLLILLLATAAGGLIKTGGLVAWKLLALKFDQLDPTRGLKRLFSADSLMRLAQGILKMGFVAAVAWLNIKGQITALLGVGLASPIAIAHRGGELVFTLALRMGIALLILGLIDYFYQRWKLGRNLRMTKQEIKDELKRMDGDPLMKQRRRQAQMKLAMQRLGIDVPKANVVVTNPTEYAVALRYDEATMSAPRCVAKGRDFLALRIRQIASQHGIPIVQRPPLARGLYAAVEVGEEIPPIYYRAVAEILAYVYRLSRRAGEYRMAGSY
jgi:flagellar biosynthetic protein FlhB